MFSPTICLAKIIEIDGVSHNVTDVLETDTYTYDATTDTLTLRNANLKTIETMYELKIILEGDNYLINDSTSLDGIDGSKLEITGAGSLNIDSKRSGISSDKILVNNTNINIKCETSGFYSNSVYDYDLIINNSNITIESKEYAFNPISTDLYLNNSNIKVVKANEFVSKYVKNTYINNTILNVLEVDTITNSLNNIYVSDFSDVKMHATNNNFSSIRYILGDNLKILGSVDGLNYQEITEESQDKYIKIFNTLDTENLKNMKDELLELEDKLNLLNNNLIAKEEELNEKDKSLKLIRDELAKREEEIKINESKINSDNKKIEEILNYLEKKEGDVKILEDDLLKEIANLANLKTNLDEKEEELKELEISLKENVKECEYVSKDSILSREESINSVENPKTFDKLLVNIGSLIISLLGIIGLIFIKKKGVLDG